MREENAFYAKLVDKVKMNQPKSQNADNRKINELQEQLNSKSKQLETLKQKHDQIFIELSNEREYKDILMKDNTKLKNDLIQKDAELLKAKTESFIKQKIGDKKTELDRYKPLDTKEPTSQQFYEIIDCQTNKLNSKE